MKYLRYLFVSLNEDYKEVQLKHFGEIKFQNEEIRAKIFTDRKKSVRELSIHSDKQVSLFDIDGFDSTKHSSITTSN